MIFRESGAVAIVIPVHDSLTDLVKSLELLKGQNLREATVVVVDDGSTDGTGAFLEQASDVVGIRGSGSLWWSGAVDLGCRIAIERNAEVVVLWNDDNITASPGCLAELVEHVRRTHGCASPVVLESRPDGSQVIRHAGGDVDWKAGGTRLRAHGKPYRPFDVVETCQWLPGNVLAFETDLFLRLDGFDARRFPQYRGDADFTLRTTNLGRPCDVLHSSWAVNDRARTGMHFDSRVSPRLFVRGLVSLKSNYHLASTLRFYVRHCPWQYVPWSIAIFYLKYLYATIKTWR